MVIAMSLESLLKVIAGQLGLSGEKVVTVSDHPSRRVRPLAVVQT